jgi:exosome complex component RRP4
LTIFSENKQLVVPGELLAEGDYRIGFNTYKLGNRIYADRLGLARIDKKKVEVMALTSFYAPLIGDLVIGKVVETNMNSWTVDINAPYLATLRGSDALNKPFKPQRDDLARFLDVGDLIVACVTAYDRTRAPSLTIREPGLGKIQNGQIMKVTPTKIPRIIGRKGSMINLLKENTKCQITVGQNGIIHIKSKNPEDEVKAIDAIQKIEDEAHTSGLTDRVTEMFKGKDKKGK